MAQRETHADMCLTRLEGNGEIVATAPATKSSVEKITLMPKREEPARIDSKKAANQVLERKYEVTPPKPPATRPGKRTAQRRADTNSPPLKQRSVPFFKILDFHKAKFGVDAFCYGPLEVDAYFLTHFHSDHYGGLSGSWKAGKIYCTPGTSRLVQLQLKVDPQYLCEVEIGVPVNVCGVNVLFLDANHCPGSAIILFDKSVLHTGDFRATPEILSQVKAHTHKLDKCYLDTTYLDPKRTFPTQPDVISSCVDHCAVVQSTVQRQFFVVPRENRLLVMVGSYTIGKERLAMAIAQHLGTKIWTAERKLKILDQLRDPDLDSLLLRNGNGLTCQVHLVSMSELSKEKLEESWRFLKKHYTHLLAFVPTGWTFRGKFDPAALPHPTYGTLEICKVPYSEHSSFEELRDFCTGLPMRRIIATVGSAHLEILSGWENSPNTA